MDVKIRTATAADFDGVGRVFAEENRYHAELLPDRFQVADPIMTRGWYDKILAEPNRSLIVAESGGDIVGVLLINLYQRLDDHIFRGRRYVYVNELAVSEDYQRQGIGRLLMAGAGAWALARGVNEIELHVWEKNSAAIAFYEKLGYRTIQRTMRLGIGE